MTDVINGKNRKGRAGYKVVLPIFTQSVSADAGAFFQRNPFQQYERWYRKIIQIDIL
jgi:hypothetical protein